MIWAGLSKFIASPQQRSLSADGRGYHRMPLAFLLIHCKGPERKMWRSNQSNQEQKGSRKGTNPATTSLFRIMIRHYFKRCPLNPAITSGSLDALYVAPQAPGGEVGLSFSCTSASTSNNPRILPGRLPRGCSFGAFRVPGPASESAT